MKRVLLSAAETSGDALGGELAQRLARRLDVEMFGLAGPAMRAAGVRDVARAEQLGVMGLVEVLGAIPEALRIRRALVAELGGIDLVVVIDAPDFNIPLARAARARGIPVVFYVSPQVWAWRRGRASEIAELAAEVICLLPFEPTFYAAAGGRARFLGHPLADRVQPLEAGGEDLAILPGSRAGEVARLLPDLVAAAALIGRTTRLPVAPGLDLAEMPGVEQVESMLEALEPAAGALVASGTATLELACLGRPMVVCYRVNPTTHALGQLLVKGVEHMALPNLILGRSAVPELLQAFTPADLAEAFDGCEAQLDDLAEVRAALRGPGARERIADAVAEHLS
ncbi:MAG: lipid-A-disaccharide synthase [Proteobacteria bacterium]|nr:lipid-A-disaccharide synthase [Pseudomonadota bacterium]MCP4920271.1 lipid-A-disaccharide synthase [Pseudomonadota bacterium]